MNVVIVEDEIPAAEQMRYFISSYKEPISIKGIYSTCVEIVKHLNRNESVDLVFCDIELRDGNVLTALQQIELRTVIVFTTAYEQFWTESLRHNGIDYLLKPITIEKIHAALDKALTLKRIFTKDSLLLKQLSDLLQRKPEVHFKKRLPVKIGNELFVIDTADVVFFRIINGVIFAVSGEKKMYPLMEETLTALEEQLDAQLFFRVNRSDIVNIRFIKSIRVEEGGDHIVLLKNNEEELMVSQSRTPQLKIWFT